MEQIKIWQQIDINNGADVEQELREYEKVIEQLLNGTLHPERFKSYRLSFGTYGVRHHGEGMHMQRIKIPGGFILSDQLRKIAELTRLYAGSGHAHLTTRQDIQLHYVTLQNIPSLLRGLAEVGITTKEACGNSVRNITASYLSGINQQEAFDVLPYTLFCTRYFLRHPLSSTLPRKFKISFSESEEDIAYSRIHDIGIVAQNGQHKGFKVYVGGGLGSVPIPSKLLIEFIEPHELYILIEAVLRVFHREGTEERKHRNKARIKFFIARIGYEKFKQIVFEEFEQLKKVRTIKTVLEEYVLSFPKPAPTRNGRADGPVNYKRLKEPQYKSAENITTELWNRFSGDLITQKQLQYKALLIKPPLGNLTPEQLLNIAELSDLYGAGYGIITPTQNILIPWIEEQFIYDVYKYVVEHSLIEKGTASTRDIVSCPGAFSCRLAVTHPYRLADYIGSHVSDLGGLRLHISGCPNSCGQHHIGDIGLFGASLKVNGKLAPHYVVLLGGNVFKQRERIGQVIGKIPALNAHRFIEDLKNLWLKERKEGEQFFEFVDRLGYEPFRKILASYANDGIDKPEFYREAGNEEDFVMEAESRGECAGSLLDVMAVNLFDAIRNIYEAEDEFKLANHEKVKAKLLEAIVKCAKMFIFLEGIELNTEHEILDTFEEKILPKQWLCHDWSDLKEKYFFWKDKPASAEVSEFISLTRKFVSDCDSAFLRLQPDLKVQQCIREEGDGYEF